MRRTAPLAAPLLLAASLAAGPARAEAPSYATWQVETLIPAACLAANIPSPGCLCLLDALERHLDLAAPLPAAAESRSTVLSREGEGYGAAIAAALQACRPAATARR